MPIPLAVPLVAGGASALYQGISGAVQTRKAKNELDNLGDRPDYEIPAGAQASLSIAQRQAQEGLPMASRNLFDANINQQQAQTASNMGDLRAGLSGVQGAAGSASQAYRQQAAMDAKMRIQNLANLQRSQEMIGGYQEKAQYENVLNDYDISRAEALGRMERGQQEKMAALQSVANLGGSMLSSGFIGGGEEVVSEPTEDGLSSISESLASSAASSASSAASSAAAKAAMRAALTKSPFAPNMRAFNQAMANYRNMPW